MTYDKWGEHFQKAVSSMDYGDLVVVFENTGQFSIGNLAVVNTPPFLGRVEVKFISTGAQKKFNVMYVFQVGNLPVPLDGERFVIYTNHTLADIPPIAIGRIVEETATTLTINPIGTEHIVLKSNADLMLEYHSTLFDIAVEAKLNLTI